MRLFLLCAGGATCMVAFLAMAGCSGAGVPGDTTGGPAGSGGSSGTGDGGAADDVLTVGASGSCSNDASDDGDGDGLTGEDGDCNDCDPGIGPDAVEVDGNQVDDNCNGIVDEVAVCDEGLALDDADPLHAAWAMGICAKADVDGYGVVEARWVDANGNLKTPNPQLGIQDRFGTSVPPLQGERMLVISSGAARTPGQASFCEGESCSGCEDPFDFACFEGNSAPPGFPQDVPGCAGGTNIVDDVGLELRLKAPANATGFRYRFRFYSWEFPEYVCTAYNDQYIALVDPPPEGAINGNISFDSATNPVSVNIAFFDVCSSCQPWASECSGSCPPVPSPCCPAGPGDLAGTGFDGGNSGAGGTSWLETKAPIQGGQEFTIRFAIWDTGDGNLDSTAVLDDFQWLGEPGVNTGTGEVPN